MRRPPRGSRPSARRSPAPFSIPVLGAPALAGAGGLLLGLASGAAREHSGSLLPAFALHLLAAVAVLGMTLTG